jgi:hypothetical protein
MAITRQTAVGAFEDRVQAQQAVRELRQMGFREEDIGIATRHDEAATTSTTETTGEETKSGTGAAAGAATGAGLGALWGIGIVAGVLPALGPVIAGGALAAVLASAATGAVVAGLAGALIGLGVPEEEAKHYEREFEAGRTIVSVQADGRYDEAVAALRRFGAYDVSGQRATTTTTHDPGTTI